MFRITIIIVFSLIALHLINNGEIGMPGLLPSSQHSMQYNQITVAFCLIFIWGVFRLLQHRQDDDING